MIGGIIAIFMAYWYYRTAQSRQLPALHWAVGGTLAFYVPNFIWSLTLAKPMLNQLHAQSGTVMATFWGFSSVIVGAAVAVAVHHFILQRSGPGSTS
jgi:hypothetical protein